MKAHKYLIYFVLWFFLFFTPTCSSLAEDSSKGAFPSCSNIYNCIKAGRDRMVMIIGKDSSEESREFMMKIASSLKAYGYSPLILRDIPDIEDLTLHEKLIAFAISSRFIVAIDNSISGHVYELGVLHNLKVPTILIRKEGIGSTYMTAEIGTDRLSARVFEYSGEDDQKALTEGIRWVESYIASKKETLRTIYPWRKQSK